MIRWHSSDDTVLSSESEFKEKENPSRHLQFVCLVGGGAPDICLGFENVWMGMCLVS